MSESDTCYVSRACASCSCMQKEIERLTDMLCRAIQVHENWQSWIIQGKRFELDKDIQEWWAIQKEKK